MRKNLNKLATLALSGMMVMSMAVPAFAFPANELTIPFTKKLYVDGETLAPQTAFDFEITPATANGKWKYQVKQGAVTKEEEVNTVPGPAGGVIVAEKATFAPTVAPNLKFKDDEENVNGKVYPYFTANAKFKIVESEFATKPYGTYEYDLVEKDSEYEGVKYSASKFKLYVMKYHMTEGGQEVDHLITKVVRVEAGNTKLTEEQKKTALGEKVSGISNNYGNPTPPPENPDTPPVTPPNDDKPNDSTHVVHIAKKIEGNGSNLSKAFKFQVSVVPASTTAVTTGEREKYAVINEGSDNVVGNHIEASAAGEELTTANHRIVTFEAGQGKGIKITGLTKGDKVIVKEIDSDTSYTVTAGEDESNYANTGSKEAGSRINKTAIDVDNDRQLDFNVLKNEAKVVVTNTKGNITPTGIVMNVAPYALMLAVAGGLGVVFVNRKKEEE